MNADELLAAAAIGNHWTTRNEALAALHTVPADRARDPLTAAVRDGDEHAAGKAMHALARMSADWVGDLLVEGLGHRSTSVRRSALHLLVLLGDPRALALVREAATTWKRDRDVPAQLLAQHGDERDVGVVAARAKQVAAKKDERLTPSELVFLVPFLELHADVPAARKALDDVLLRGPQLKEETRVWLGEHVTSLASLAEPDVDLPAEAALALRSAPSDGTAVVAALARAGVVADLWLTSPTTGGDLLEIVHLRVLGLWLVPSSWPPVRAISHVTRRGLYRAVWAPDHPYVEGYRGGS